MLKNKIFPSGSRKLKVKWTFFAALYATQFFTPTSAFAILLSFSHAKSFSDKAICSDNDLKVKDADLNAAYSNILKSIKNRNFKNIIIFSQHRWLKARETQFRKTNDDYRDTVIQLFQNEIESRRKDIESSSFIKRIENANRFSAQYTGGEYAGNEITCFFTPPGFGDGSYNYFGSITFQNHNRICRLATDWASGHTTRYRTVGSATTNAGATMIATCTEGYAATNEPCPAQNTNHANGWNFQPKASDATPILRRYRNHSAKRNYDPDFEIIPSDEQWLNACLTDPDYPAPEH